MKKLVLVLTFVLGLVVLAGCNKKDENTIVVGSSYVPHADILEQAKPLLKEKGYTLKIVKFQDYILPNLNLTQGELDANYFQHIPYLNTYNEENNTNIVSVGGIHIEPIGIYSKTITRLEDVTSGTRVIMSNSISDKPRLLTLLINQGLINLSLDINLMDVNLSELQNNPSLNPKGLKFINNVDPGLLVTTYKNETNAIVLINTNYALDGGLKPSIDALALEEGTTDNPYVNIIAVNAGNENNEKVKALVEVMKSETIRNYILETYDGAIIPAE